tara:strand:+ start:6131 stop:6538 length:408 start_codon:yes stop_codon:yes gene_type:complete
MSKETPPDNVVWSKDNGYDANVKNYPTTLSAPKFDLPNVGLVKTDSAKKMVDVFNREKEEILELVQKLQAEYSDSMLVWESKMSFEPIVGHSYYLYDFDGVNTLSLLSPKDWGKFNEKLIGGFTLNSNRKWIRMK